VFLREEQDTQENISRYKEIAGDCGKLHDEKFHSLYPLTNTIRVLNSMMMILVGHVACLRNKRGTYKTIVRKLEGKELPGRTRLR
jgi:hypothetical protein